MKVAELAAWLALLAAPVAVEIATRPGDVPTAFPSALAPAALPIRGVVLGDSRDRPRVEFYRDDPDEARREVLAQVATERPDFIIYTGDFVYQASEPREWARWDREAALLRATGAPLWAARGNHEYNGRRSSCDARLTARVPALAGRHFYAADAGPVRWLLLDSNFDELPPAVRDAQSLWLRGELARAEADPAVRFVFLAFHHAPYTNAPTHRPSLVARRELLDPARAFPKCRAAWVGHVHTYERFDLDGFQVVVTGGGGAPTVGVETDPAKLRTPAVATGLGASRPVHYARLTIFADRVEVEIVMRVAPARWAVVDRFTIPG